MRCRSTQLTPARQAGTHLLPARVGVHRHPEDVGRGADEDDLPERGAEGKEGGVQQRVAALLEALERLEGDERRKDGGEDEDELAAVGKASVQVQGAGIEG